MCDQDKYASLPQGEDPAHFNACGEDQVLPDDVDREQASRSSLENCEVPNESSYLPDNGPASLVAEENPYYEKLIGIDPDPAAYPEDLIMIAGSVDVRDDTKPLLLSEQTISESCSDVSPELSSKGHSSNSEKTIMVMPEDIEAAGLNIQNLNDLTDAQFNTLVEIAERRQKNAGATLTSHIQYDDQVTNNSSNSDSLTMVITEDGSLKVTDACGQMLVFDRTQLAALRIDVNNLTDESIQQIVQLAMPAICVGGKSTEMSLEMSKADSQHSVHSGSKNLSNRSDNASFKRNDTGTRAAGQLMEERNSDQIPPRNASIRYVKNGRWKVQYEDGRFEWVGEDNSSVCEVKPIQHSDHSGYHAGDSSGQSDSSVIMSSPRVKRPCSRDSPFDGGPAPLKRRGITQAPNFCCPVCDRKVYQKEPSYIVIRLPACDDCTKGKMIVLDERTKRLSIPSSRK